MVELNIVVASFYKFSTSLCKSPLELTSMYKGTLQESFKMEDS